MAVQRYASSPASDITMPRAGSQKGGSDIDAILTVDEGRGARISNLSSLPCGLSVASITPAQTSLCVIETSRARIPSIQTETNQVAPLFSIHFCCSIL
jgi:hypothetical protein